MDDTNPYDGHQVTMRPQKDIVWYGFWTGGIIEWYLFESDVDEVITINGERYKTVITNFLWSKYINMT